MNKPGSPSSTPPPQIAEIKAPAAWTCVDIISDVHLQESQPVNFLAWRHFLENSPADAIFILGDLFELWVGDDALSISAEMNLATRHEGLHFEDRCTRVLHYCAERVQLYFMHGNRDFMIGEGFLKTAGAQGLTDPTVLAIGGQRILLTHGDALCLSDTEYLAFRAKVRDLAWQREVLTKPLAERRQFARNLRTQSELRLMQRSADGQPWIDIDQPEAVRWMDAAKTQHLIHGHTHEGRSHAITSAQGQGQRHVLSDWHLGEQPARGDAMRLSVSDGQLEMRRVPIRSA
jgi:UDP-2,3-diacylglucosamine hydrolase